MGNNLEHQIDKEYCKSCGALLYGKFCSNCGEKKFDKKDLTFKKIILQFIDGLTHFDSKILSGVKLLITKPGLLAKEYCSGARVKYAKPLQLFFIINVVFFIMLSVGGFNTFTTPLYHHMTTSKYNTLAESMVNHKLQKENISPEEYTKRISEYEKKFDAKVNIFSKSLIILIVPVFAFVLYLLFINRGRLYTESFIFALNFLSWLLLFYILLAVISLIRFLHININSILNDDIMTPVIFVSIGTYCFFASMRFYEEKRWTAFFKCIILPYLFFWVLNVYRFILFIITFYST